MTCQWNDNYCAENINAEIPADQINPNIRFFYKQHFYNQHQWKLAKNQAKAKQHPEAELLLFENYSLSSSTLSFKNKRRYSKK